MTALRIYTRTGDKGETGLFGAGRVSKADPRVAAYGDVDELNAWIGVASACLGDTGLGDTGSGDAAGTAAADTAAALEQVQQDLFVLGAILATPDPERRKGEKFELTEERIGVLERQIDAWEEELPSLDSFILPGGSRAGAFLHAARTVCRRAERVIVDLDADDLPETVLPYLNRLSDWLFVCARVVNRRAGVEETTW